MKTQIKPMNTVSEDQHHAVSDNEKAPDTSIEANPYRTMMQEIQRISHPIAWSEIKAFYGLK